MNQISPGSKSVRILLWIGAILGGLLLTATIFRGVMISRMEHIPATVHTADAPLPNPDTLTPPSSELDFSTTRLSDHGLFRVSYMSSQDVIPINQIHQWTLHIETPEGQPVENATITVDGDMPEHGHGLPTRPQVTEYLGNGDYLVEGIKFQMGGWWVMDFTVTADSHTDAVHFNMKLN
jgi:hypothetical protein